MTLSLPPASVLSTWPPPNYVNPIKRGPVIYIIPAICLGLSTTVVFTRLYARLFIRRWFGLDDLLIILAWLSTIGVTAVVFIGDVHFGWDRHIWDSELAWWAGKL
jgi:hypothetical protein